MKLVKHKRIGIKESRHTLEKNQLFVFCGGFEERSYFFPEKFSQLEKHKWWEIKYVKRTTEQSTWSKRLFSKEDPCVQRLDFDSHHPRQFIDDMMRQ